MAKKVREYRHGEIETQDLRRTDVHKGVASPWVPSGTPPKPVGVPPVEAG